MNNIKRVIEKHYPDHEFITISNKYIVLKDTKIKSTKKDPGANIVRKPVAELLDIICASVLLPSTETKKPKEKTGE